MNISVSLICATKNRYAELKNLLQSLSEQSSLQFELIIVDQNESDLILDLVEKFKDKLSIIYLRNNFSNSSKARNQGAECASGLWLGFPDDDCWYPKDFVQMLIGQVRDEYDGIFINWTDPMSSKVRFQFSEGQMTKDDAFTLASCICLFIKKLTFVKAQGFNEKFGLGEGTVIKAGEEQELTLRLLRNGAYIRKYPDAAVHHRIVERDWDESFKSRIVSQGACDFLFTKRFKGFFEGYWLLVGWLAAIGYNMVLFRTKNINWYWLKLKGALTAPSYNE